MKIREIIVENDEEDMFGQSDRVGNDLRRATYQPRIPSMVKMILGNLEANAGPFIKQVAVELGRDADVFRRDPEIFELADDLLTQEVMPQVSNILLSLDPVTISDEDALNDALTDHVANIRNGSDLWIYIEEILGDGGEDAAYMCAMTIEGEIGALLLKLVQQAYNETKLTEQGVAEGNEINRAVEDLVQQVDFVDIVYKIARQKYPQVKFEKLDDMRIQVDVSGENNDPFDYKNYQGFFVMGMTYSNDEGTEVGVLINDAYSGPYKGIILPAIKLATEKCLQLVPNATPTLWVDDDESGGIWNEIAKKLGYKFEILNEGKQGVAENFHDGKNPQDKGDSKRHGVPTKASISTLRKVAKQGGRKGQLAHWMANMKSGRAKAKK